MRSRLTITIAIIIALLLIGGFVLLRPTRESAASKVATEFVAELQDVSLTADSETLENLIAEHYAPYVTPELLAQWQADPASAPGRETSSPWPDRIFIKSVTRQGESIVINADVLYMTSAEVATPEEDAAGVMVVVIQLIPTDEGWRIAAYEELFSEWMEGVEPPANARGR